MNKERKKEKSQNEERKKVEQTKNKKECLLLLLWMMIVHYIRLLGEDKHFLWEDSWIEIRWFCGDNVGWSWYGLKVVLCCGIEWRMDYNLASNPLSSSSMSSKLNLSTFSSSEQQNASYRKQRERADKLELEVKELKSLLVMGDPLDPWILLLKSWLTLGLILWFEGREDARDCSTP